MIQRTITITIKDTDDGNKCNAEIHFNPPLRKGEPQTAAMQAAKLCLEAMQSGAHKFKSKSVLYEDGSSRTETRD